MTTLATDTFVRANQSGFGTASDGKTWTHVTAGSDTDSIVANEGQLINYSAGYSYELIGTGTATTINILCRMNASSASQLPGVTFRYTDINNNYIVGFFGQQVYIDKFVAGTRSQVGASAVLSTWAINDYWWLRAIMSGTAITVTAWKDGTSEPGTATVTGTDSSFSSGQYGIVSQTFASTTNSFDSLTVTDNQSGTTIIVNASDNSNASDIATKTMSTSKIENTLATMTVSFSTALTKSDVALAQDGSTTGAQTSKAETTLATMIASYQSGVVPLDTTIAQEIISYNRATVTNDAATATDSSTTAAALTRSDTALSSELWTVLAAAGIIDTSLATESKSFVASTIHPGVAIATDSYSFTAPVAPVGIAVSWRMRSGSISFVARSGAVVWRMRR